MREFKFRVWNTCTKRMCGNEYLEETVKNISKIKNIQGLFLPKHEDNIVMQYTGVDDMYGKEIYEGDILEYDITGEKHLIYWDDEESKFIGKGFYNSFQDVPWDLFSESAYELCKIIGNKYENPELLD